MILSVFTTIAAAATVFFGASLLASSVDVFYVFIGLQVALVLLIKIAHHSSESKVRFDNVGGLFVFFTSSASLLLGLLVITNTIIFKGL